MRTPLLTRVGI